ncbi:hypothetical protein IP84_16985 [beta proteobacterium AAP99]|nr:hypothetical protein IP84_16985 [beta proteobacterium AAP99]
MTPLQIGELEQRDFWGDETWRKWKGEMDALLARRKSFKGRPDEIEVALLKSDAQAIEAYKFLLFHSVMLGVDECACPRCAKKRQARKSPLKAYT